MDNTAKTIGRTICDVLLSTSPSQQQQHLISSYEKQVQAMETLRSLAPEEKQKLLLSHHDNHSSQTQQQQTQALKVRTLLKIDSLQNSIFGSSLPVKTTRKRIAQENEEEEDDEDDENEKQKSEITPSDQFLLQQIIQEARASCQIHRLPRPGTEPFFGVSSDAGNKNQNNASSSQRESGKRRQRTGADHDAEKVKNELQQDGDDMFDLGTNGKPVVDGVSFVALATCVARSLTTGKKFEELLEKGAIDLSSNEVTNHSSRSNKSNADDSNNDQGNAATYRLVHLVVTLVLHLFRRIQCYSQCELDLQSRIAEQQNVLVSTTNTESESVVQNKVEGVSKNEAASVSLVRRALKNCKHPAQKMDGERFLNVSVSDPVRSQRTFYNSQTEDRIVVTVATDSSRGGKNEEMKLVGKLKVSRLAVDAAIDSMKQ